VGDERGLYFDYAVDQHTSGVTVLLHVEIWSLDSASFPGKGVLEP
jgi:hypothetical protein